MKLSLYRRKQTYRLYQSAKTQVVSVTLATILTIAGFGAALPVLTTSLVEAVTGVSYSSDGFDSFSWSADRRLPSGGWSVSGNSLSMTVDGNNPPVNGFYSFEGVKAALPERTNNVSARLYIDPNWSDQSVIAGMWGQAPGDGTPGDYAWPTLEFNNLDHEQASVDVWDTFDGVIKGVTTVAYGSTIELEIETNVLTDTFTYYLNGTSIFSSPAQGYGPLSHVIFNNYNDSSPSSQYTTLWSDLKVGTTVTPSPTNLRWAVDGSTVACGNATSRTMSSPTWDAVSGATSYDYQYKSPDSTVWSDGGNYTTTTTGPTAFGTTEGIEGQWQFRVRSVTPSGTSDWSAGCSILFDKTAPTVTLTAPTTPWANSGTVLRIEAADNLGLQRVVANVRDSAGTLVLPTQSSAGGTTNHTHTVVLDTLAEGSYSVRYNAVDLTGRLSSTKNFAFTIDRTGPTATVKPSPDTEGTSPYRKVSFKLHDSRSGVDKVVLNGVTKDLTNSAWSDLNGVRPGVFGAVEGNNTLVIYDVAGNTTTTQFVLDTTTPAPSVLGENFNTHQGTDYSGINVGFRLNDFRDVSSVTVALRVDGATLVSNTGNAALLALINDDNVTQLSTPFISMPGTYTEAYWDLGAYTWTAESPVPTDALVTVTGTDSVGLAKTASVTLSPLNAGPPSWPSFASILPTATSEPEEEQEEGQTLGATTTNPQVASTGSSASAASSRLQIASTLTTYDTLHADSGDQMSNEAITQPQVLAAESDAENSDSETVQLETAASDNASSTFAWWWLVVIALVIGALWFLLGALRHRRSDR